MRSVFLAILLPAIFATSSAFAQIDQVNCPGVRSEKSLVAMQADFRMQEASSGPTPRIRIASMAVPQLSSKPNKPKKLFLDFDGPLQTENTAVGVFDLNGDPSTFSQGEIDAMTEIWARVAEIYSPFGVDVTTIDPGTRNDLKTMVIVVGNAPSMAVGGYAYIGGFYSPFFVSAAPGMFSQQISAITPKLLLQR